MSDVTIIAIVACVLIIALHLGYGRMIGSQQRTIDRQNDTIQRLIQREPVTYAEVGTKPPRKSKEVFAAWGSQMVNIDEDEVELK